jgi:type IV secretory pathway TraG/TraD family ATPase VirD4
MASDAKPRPPGSETSGWVLLFGPLAVLVGGLLLSYHGAVLLAGLLTGHVPDVGVADTAKAIWSDPASPLDGYPEAAGKLPPPLGVWVLFGLAVVVVVFGAALAWKWWSGRGARREGTATKHQIEETLGGTAVRKRASRDRPSLAGQKNLDFRAAAVYVGRDKQSGKELWSSHEDSFYVIGPPRSGKTVSLCVPLVLDAPGALVASSTKADLLMAAAIPRAEQGPVWVFDPENISGWPDVLRWSPVTGCDDPRVAIRRADAIVAAKPLGGDSGNTGFFTEAAGTVLRCLLHAAALGGRSMRDVVRWVADFTELEPLDILRTHPGAVRPWAEDLRTYTQGPANETSASLKMTLALVLKSLANPRVLDMVSPAPHEQFDVEDFIRNGGSIFLLNNGEASGSTAPLVTCLVDDIGSVAKRLSQSYPSGRLDPPLRVVLDEAATGCPLPGLPTYMADSGGRGVTMCAVVQTFAQARARWGQNEAGQIFGASTTKLVLGGVPEADDLESLSRLCGERDVGTTSYTKGSRGEVSVSTASRRERVYTPTEIREMPPGTGLLLYRNLPPAMIRLQPWMDRPDAEAIKAGMKQAKSMTAGKVA